MLLALFVFVIAVLAFLAGHGVATVAGEAIQKEMGNRLAERGEMYKDARARIQFLEMTLDEVRAKQLDTSLPIGTDSGVKVLTLPEEVEQELAQIEDEAGRDEYREQALLIVEQFPELEPAEIINRVFR